jgi:hypothetical protein
VCVSVWGGGGGGRFGSNGIVTKAQSFLMDGHYRTDIISSVGYPRSDSVVLLVLCTIACNICGTSIVLQVPQNSVNPLRICNILGKPYG